MKFHAPLFALLAVALLSVTGCNGDFFSDKETTFPQRDELRRAADRGRLTGDGLSLLGGTNAEGAGAGNNPLGVNAFLWRATLDTLSFLPLASADPFGGVVLTDWYEDPNTRGERFKVSALILDRSLRADGIQVSVFKQQRDAQGNWADAPAPERLARKLEDTILTRARELRVTNMQ